MGRLDSTIAVVTGAGHGLGLAIGLRFADEGAAVAVVDGSALAARAAAEEIRGRGHRAIAVACDVGDEAQVAWTFEEIGRALGEVDVLVNNAGIDTTGEVVSMALETWDEMLRVNLRGVFLCSRAVLPAMLRRGSGRIINVSSQLADKGAATMAHYSAATAGVLGFTRSLALEVGPCGVLVNAVAPGPVDTDLWRAIPNDWRAHKLAELALGRAARVEEIVPTVLLLAGEDGGYYQGATLNPGVGDVMA